MGRTTYLYECPTCKYTVYWYDRRDDLVHAVLPAPDDLHQIPHQKHKMVCLGEIDPFAKDNERKNATVQL